jgi:amylosucrase
MQQTPVANQNTNGKVDFATGLETDLRFRHKLDERDTELFLMRLRRYWQDFLEPFTRLYGQHPRYAENIAALGQMLVDYYAARSAALKRLDLERTISPDWFLSHQMVGGIYYVDLFAGNLQGVLAHLDYMREMHLNYIHLMPLLQPRPEANDGGYAVEDYRQVNPELGTMADLEELAGGLREHGMSLCIDLVVNHTAKEHEWARKALAGDPEFLDYFLTFDERTLPDMYERTLPEVFPDFAPGNFTFYPEMGTTGKWVWTTFNEFQWDLNYTNPAVFRGMFENMLYLANRGVDVLRLDAVPFMWKRMGTNCQNQPEVHDILQAWRALLRIVTPGTIFKAEAIVAPHDLIQYLGQGRHTGKECDLAYNNSLMVLVWSALASRKVHIMIHTLKNMPPAPFGSTWINYVRLHDDIGWAVTNENAGAVGEDGYQHRLFLSEFYGGKYPDSFAVGDIFQLDVHSKEARISGMTASLAGLEKALRQNNAGQIELSIKRILLLYSVIFVYNGIPLIYMGDELGFLNDHSYLNDPHKANDNRWMHRPPMNWETAARRHDHTNLTGFIYREFRQLIEARRRLPVLHSSAPAEPLWTDNQHVFGCLRSYMGQKLLALANFSEYGQSVSADILNQYGVSGLLHDVRDPAQPPLVVQNGRIELAPYQTRWLTALDGG